MTTTTGINRIAVLITCHNRREKTLSCLQALFAQALPKGVNLTVYLVDDGCTDGTGDAIRQQFPGVRVLQGDGNLYWCGGMRFAWGEAMKEDYDAYIWLNDDTILLPAALEAMLRTAIEVRQKEGRDGIIVGSCRDPQTGEHTYGGRIRRSRRSRLADSPRPPSNSMLPCDTINGNLVLVPRDVFQRVGNLSAEFVHAFGDVDYGSRAKKQGFDCWMAPGHLAECKRNLGIKPFTDPLVPLAQRWRNLNSPHGLPPLQWYVYVRRHTGWHWPFYFCKPILRVAFPRLFLRNKTCDRAPAR